MKASQMKNAGLPDAALGRVKAQMEEGSNVPIGEGTGASKPRVKSVEKYAIDNETGNDIPYKEFIFASDPSIIFSGSEEMTGGQLALYILEHYGSVLWDYMDLPDGVDELGEPEDYPGGEDEYYEKLDALRDSLVDKMSVDDVERIIIDHLDIGQRDNSYNWSWWGPTVLSHLLGPASPDGSAEPYEEGAIIVSMHLGGDVRGNYGNAKAFKLNSYAEEAPWYRYGLTVYITTDRGEITLDAEDSEAYHFHVHKDETGTWGEGDNITYDDIDKLLEWGGDGPFDLWA